MSEKWDDDDPAVIKARAEAKARLIEARSKMHPAAQVVFTILDKVEDIVHGVGCLIILAIVLIAIFAPQLFNLVLGR